MPAASSDRSRTSRVPRKEVRRAHGNQKNVRGHPHIRTKYCWPKVFKDIKKFVRHCDLCQRYKQSTFSSGLLQPIPVHAQFHTVGLDVIGPFRSSRRYKFVIVATDYLTKFAEAKPVRNTIQNFIERRLVLKHGCRAVIIADRETQMMARSTESLLRGRGIKPNPTTAYRLAANGLCERANKTIKQMMTLVTAGGEKLADIFRHVTFCYNTKHYQTQNQESTKQSPFFLVYGRNRVLPLDVVFNRVACRIALGGVR
ncbi:uncharacterized protein LOC135400547 [Ornithodoros turicata]|uniref:uncharacterized protein LOC135400547 n=1 Tax=Ornithodoros turicata TaxID=34597 RepID=UPI0031391FA8